jgi:hypothetical protein
MARLARVVPGHSHLVNQRGSDSVTVESHRNFALMGDIGVMRVTVIGLR